MALKSKQNKPKRAVTPTSVNAAFRDAKTHQPVTARSTVTPLGSGQTATIRTSVNNRRVFGGLLTPSRDRVYSGAGSPKFDSMSRQAQRTTHDAWTKAKKTGGSAKASSTTRTHAPLRSARNRTR